MRLFKGIISLSGIVIIGGLAGCSLGSLPPLTQPTQPSQPISVLFVEAPPLSLAVNASATIDAAVENSPSIGQVNYTIACASAGACGSLTASDEGGAIVYTAPSSIPSGNTVTVTATAVADTTKSISGTITIVPPIPISVSFSGPTPASLAVNSQATFRATIGNDVSANPQVNWTVTCGGNVCGSFSPTATTSYGGTTYTAPSAIPSGNSVTVTATSVTDPTKSVSASITITPEGPTLANGTYVFQLSGPAGYNASFTTGVLAAQNGAITGGELDYISGSSDENGYLTSYAYFEQISGGSYATTPDGNLQIDYQSSGGSYTLNGALASGGKGLVAQLYGLQGSGTLDLQTATVAPLGGYAMSLNGSDQYGYPAWIGGILNIDSVGGISGTGSVLDVVDLGYNGVPSGEESLAASTVGTPDKFGRVQFQLNPSQSSILPAENFVGYIVDATHVRLMSTINTTAYYYQGVMGGTAIGQGANTGKFSANSLSGSSYVFGGADAIYGTTFAVAGVTTANADGTLSGALNSSELGGQQAQGPLSFTGTFTVDPTGRATLNLADGSNFNYSMHLYLTGDGNGLLLSSGGSEPFAGQVFQQQAAPFTAASLSGTYGLNAEATAPVVGSLTSVPENGTDTMTGFADSGNGAADFATSGSLTAAANGVFTGTLTGLDAASRTTTNNFTFYLVDSTRAVAIETDNAQLMLGYLELQD